MVINGVNFQDFFFSFYQPTTEKTPSSSQSAVTSEHHVLQENCTEVDKLTVVRHPASASSSGTSINTRTPKHHHFQENSTWCIKNSFFP